MKTNSFATYKENEPVLDKTINLGFRRGPTQSRLYSDSIKLEIFYIMAEWRKQRRLSATAQLICDFVFTYANRLFSHAKVKINLFIFLFIYFVRSFI